MNRQLSLAFSTLTLIVLLAGCGAAVREDHYFASYRPDDPLTPNVPVNFFRLRVEGAASFSNARYLSGYYDERAVDLFFNEMKAPANQRLFDESIKPPGFASGEVFKPLSPVSGQGAYLLIMSTNADSIANAIGSFAESQVVADALTRALNKDRFAAKAHSDVEVQTLTARAAVMTSKIRLALDNAKQAAAGDDAQSAYLRALLAIAQALGYKGSAFKDFPDAQRWFDIESNVAVAK